MKRENLIVKLSEIKLNEDNPRTITDKQMKRLVKSIQDFPEMTQLRPIVIDENNVILGGNMRYRAMQGLGYTETEVVKVSGLTAEQKREFIIKDNVPFGDWDWDILANKFDAEELNDWGLDTGVILDSEAVTEQASSDDAVREFNEDTNYDESKFIRYGVNSEISKKIELGGANGDIRDSLLEVFKMRATQCAVFNFDELTKLYRSGDTTDLEKELLLQLFLVFEVPKELFDREILKLNSLSGEIYADELLEKRDE